MHRTDKAWNEWGARHPYYGVLTSEEYRGAHLSNAAKETFFESGRAHLDRVLAAIRTHLDPGFSPKRAVDFGCGTGRVLTAIAQMCDDVLGIDVSDAMLAECRSNCLAINANNVSLEKSDDRLSALSGHYDFAHSFIVFQHIPRLRGEKMVPILLDHLGHKGIAVLHFVYEWKASFRQRLAYFARHHLPLGHELINQIRRQGIGEPRMEMNLYDMTHLFQIIGEAGCGRLHVEFVRHGAHHGAILYVQKG